MDINDFGKHSCLSWPIGLKERLEKCTMINQLFKLKKDGKAVGYLQFAKYSNNDLHIQVRSDDSEWDDDIDLIDYNSIHLFVTKDRLGKEIFAGDKVKAVISDVSDTSLVGTIVQNDNPLACWMFKYRFDEEDFGEKEYLAPAPDLQDIEIIEGKDNE